MISVRNVLTALALAFTAYLGARGLWWTEPVPQPLVVFATLGLYLATTWLCIFWEQPIVRADTGEDAADVSARGPTVLPVWGGVLALASAAIVPSAIAYAVGPDARTASFATWYLGGIGALMTIVMVRRRPWVAWIGIVLLAVASMLWMGPVDALALGLVGSVVWVAVAQLLVRSLDRAARDTSRLAQLQRAASAWQAAQLVRRRERRVQVQRALAVAGPVLSRTVARGGRLDDEDRRRARIAEGSLRDEIRAPKLLDDAVREQLREARGRGATVTVLDEGWLDGLDQASLDSVRARLADAVRASTSARLFIRTSPDERIAATVVGRSASGPGLSDEDVVDLWVEIPRAPESDEGDEEGHAPRPGGGGDPGREAE
ncbi:hypothetical protein GCM10022200_13410 [Microbacterium awajiense]|uniref:Uncharacterized protein n=1 Tax=Microbacterium awajiense TaxID=415214 RepID=A0ABP7AGN0_9MICO